MVPDYAAIAGHINNFGGQSNSEYYSTSYGPHARNGVMSFNSKVQFKNITDGLSKTIMVGEVSAPVRGADEEKDWRPGEKHGFAAGCQGPNSNSQNLNGAGAAGKRVFNTTTIRYRINTQQSFTGPDGQNRCSDGVCPNGNNYPLRSRHPGGVHVLFVDGATAFLNEAVEDAVLAALAAKADGNAVSQ